MSLDVYLTTEDVRTSRSRSGIFIREDGQIKEISRLEWGMRHPGREPVTAQPDTESRTAYHANITHNLNEMAGEAGLYKAMWRPDEHGYTTAKQILPILKHGLAVLELTPSRFEKFNPKNGWGSYEVLVEFVREYIAACEEFPEAEIRVSR